MLILFVVFCPLLTLASLDTVSIKRTVLSRCSLLSLRPPTYLFRGLDVFYVPNIVAPVVREDGAEYTVDDDHWCSVLADTGFRVHVLLNARKGERDDDWDEQGGSHAITRDAIAESLVWLNTNNKLESNAAVAFSKGIAVVAHELSNLAVLALLADLAVGEAAAVGLGAEAESGGYGSGGRVGVTALCMVDPPPLTGWGADVDFDFDAAASAEASPEFVAVPAPIDDSEGNLERAMIGPGPESAAMERARAVLCGRYLRVFDWAELNEAIAAKSDAEAVSETSNKLSSSGKTAVPRARRRRRKLRRNCRPSDLKTTSWPGSPARYGDEQDNSARALNAVYAWGDREGDGGRPAHSSSPSSSSSFSSPSTFLRRLDSRAANLLAELAALPISSLSPSATVSATASVTTSATASASASSSAGVGEPDTDDADTAAVPSAQDTDAIRPTTDAAAAQVQSRLAADSSLLLGPPLRLAPLACWAQRTSQHSNHQRRHLLVVDTFSAESAAGSGIDPGLGGLGGLWGKTACLDAAALLGAGTRDVATYQHSAPSFESAGADADAGQEQHQDQEQDQSQQWGLCARKRHMFLASVLADWLDGFNKE